MDRRAFLKLLGAATAAAIAAPSVVVEAYAVPPIAPVAAAAPRGLAYLVANSGTYFSIDRSTAMPYLGSSPAGDNMVDYD